MRRFNWLRDEENWRARSRAATRHHVPAIEALESRIAFAGVTATYTVGNSWTTGLQAEIRMANTDSAAVSNWRLEFDYAGQITSIWNAQILSRVGDHYTIVGAAWNSSMPANTQTSFGFVANGTGAIAPPANYRLNGAPLGGAMPALPSLSVGDATVVEGNSGTTNLTFDVTLSAPASGNVSVSYATAAGTATAGSDYQNATGTLVFAAGETKKSITVKVTGDAQVEPDETLKINLASPLGATLARAQANGTIKNDDAPPAGGNVSFQVVTDWGTGFTGQITIRNPSASAINNWQLEFDFAGQIANIWDGKFISRVGNHYVVANAGWNATIPAGGSASFGFVATPGGSGLQAPTNYLVNSVSAGGGSGGGGGANQAPVAVNDAVNTLPGQAARIAVLANDSDPNGDALSVASITQPKNGTAVLNSDGTIAYTPAAGFKGVDTFTYVARDPAGATSQATVSINVAAATAWPAQVYAPYVDMGLYPTYDLVSAARAQSVKYFTLAFIVADADKQPSWGGYREYAVNDGEFDTQVRAQIAGVRALGGDVMVSFGGAANQELAEVITDMVALKDAYRKVVDAYGLTRVDFDIEGAAVANRASVDRRSQALAALQSDLAAAGRPLEIWYTLPVLPSGLTADGLYILQSAKKYGLNIGGVNIMTMDYGDGAAPNPQGRMGDYAIQAATSLFNQLKGLFGTAKTDAQLWKLVGVTPMIGLNDVTTEVFDQSAARQLLAFARQMGISRISIWSLNRDQANRSGRINYVENTSSSIPQSTYEFSTIFGAFTA